MGVDGALQILGAGRKLHRQHCLGYEFTRHRTDDVNSEYLVVIHGGEDFGKTGRLLQCFGPPIRSKIECTGLVSHASFLEFLLGFADQAISGAV